MLHLDTVWRQLAGGPGSPANKAVNRVQPLRLGERELVMCSRKGVAAVLQPVRPWDQYLATPRRAYLVDPVAVEQVAALHRIATKAAADRNDDSPLLPVGDLVLRARRSNRNGRFARAHANSSRRSSGYSVRRLGSGRGERRLGGSCRDVADLFDFKPTSLRSSRLVAVFTVGQPASLGGGFTSRARGPVHPGDPG